MRQNLSPRDPADLRRAFGCFATGVTVVTTRAADGTLVGVTASSLTSVSLEPALLLVSLSDRLQSLPVFEQAGAFAINVLGRSHAGIARQFATSLSDKWRDIGYSTGHTGLPVLDDASAVFECATARIVPAGDHHLFIGRIVRVAMSDVDDPLIFHRGRFTTTLAAGEQNMTEHRVH